MPSSFKGVPFHSTTGEWKGGSRLVQHEFPFHDVPFIENLGRKARIYNVVGFVIGDNWEQERENLKKACEVGTAGTLITPEFGSVRVICKDIGTDESKVDANKKCDVNFVFIEAGVITKPESKIDTQVKLRLNIVESITKLTKDFKTAYDIVQKPQFIADTMKAVVGSVSDTILKTTSQTLFKAATDLVAVDITDTVKLADAISKVFIDETDDSTLSKVFGSIVKASIPLTTDNRKTQSTNEDILINMFDNLSVLSKIRQTSYEDFPSYTDALSVRDDVLVNLDKQIESNQDKEPVYSALSSVKTEFISDINVRAPELSRLVNKTFNTVLPTLVMAYDFYGDATRSDEIINRNKIRNPLLSGGGQNVELLSA